MDRPGTEPRCNEELTKAQAASYWLGCFLARGRYHPERVRCAQLQKAPMDQVSMLNKLFAHNKRRPSSGEWILLEEMVQERGVLLQFVDQLGRMYRERAASTSGVGTRFRPDSCPCASSPSSCCLDSRELLEAFVHFTHHASGGQVVVCGLEGLQNEQGQLVLKTPVLHSKDKAYGETDLGLKGIEEVMSRHVCNRHCRKVLKLRHQPSSAPSLLLSDGHPHHHPPPPPSSSSPPSFFSRDRRCPSAPFDPDVLFGSDVTSRSPSVAAAPPYDMVHLGIDVARLPLDVFASPTDLVEAVLFQLEQGKNVPDEPPPPYTEFIGDLM